MCPLALWFASMVLTLACCGVFVVAGMIGHDAVAHAAGMIGLVLCAVAVVLGAKLSKDEE